MGFLSFLDRFKRSHKSTAAPTVTLGSEEVTSTRYIAGGLSVPKSRELFEVVQMKEVLPRLPDDFAGGNVGHFLFSGTPLTSEFKSKGAGRVLAGYLGRVRTQKSTNDIELRFRSAPDRLALKEWSCRWALVSAPSVPALPVVRLIKELGRVLEPGGGGAIIDWHPYSGAVRNILSDRPTVDTAEGMGLEKYYAAFQEAGMMATHVKETFVDGSLRKMMETQEDKEWYNNHRKEPFAIVFFVKKRNS